MQMAVPTRRFTVDEYQRMGEVGILNEDDRVELIDGEVVAMTPVGTRHNGAINRANRTLIRLVGDRAIVQPQGSVRLDVYNEPQPDFVLLRPRDDFYASRYAGPADILVAIEMADSSLAYDRSVKARLYARLGVPEYWLVDLARGRVIRHTGPDADGYRETREHDRDESLVPRLLPDCPIPVRELLAD